ncbi:MAG: hydantoinase/oxoprolinase family protein [Terriglobia bacterium]|jgi:N-methylhydantoinase A
MRVGVDTGGTFTDCVIIDHGEVKILKVFSTPEDASRGILEGVRRLAQPVQPATPLEIIHGTTVGTNSLLERRGARVALVTTQGFEDLLEIGRQARPRLYDLEARHAPPLVPRELRIGIKERTAANGTILDRPSSAAIARVVRQLKRLKAESIALCFLFSYLNPDNERAVAKALKALHLPVSVSHEILPEFREYERLATVVINAYLIPRMGEYLERLEHGVGEELAPLLGGGGESGRVYVMQSSGGISTAQRAAREPVRTILSGPAGGVVASTWLARQLGLSRALSFDMGGTSTDVCLIDGLPRTTNETTLGGLPVAVPVLDVHSVGAGGGSLARLDAGGALRVGPESAGAKPGPICYHRGGVQPTVTDANLLLGRLDADLFLGGEFRLDLQATDRGFADFLRLHRREIGSKTAAQLAADIVAVSNATMEKALRVISVERGHDPRDFALICFGGGGGLHAADLARGLRLPKVVVPRNPGAFSALGILLSDIVRDSVRSVFLRVHHDGEQPKLWRQLESRFAIMERASRAELQHEGFPAQMAQAEQRLDVRYAGQSYDLSVPFKKDFRRLFDQQHLQAYGYSHPGRRIEIVNLRLRLSIRTPKPPLRVHKTRHAAPAKMKSKLVWFDGRFRTTPVYDRERLAAGSRLRGLAVIVEYSSSTVVPPDFRCEVDKYLNLVLTRYVS